LAAHLYSLEMGKEEVVLLLQLQRLQLVVVTLILA
jgi:hypothetical protein